MLRECWWLLRATGGYWGFACICGGLECVAVDSLRLQNCRKSQNMRLIGAEEMVVLGTILGEWLHLVC